MLCDPEPFYPCLCQQQSALKYISFTNRVGLISDNVIVAWILGASALSPFYLTQQLPGAAQFLLRGLGNATWAGLVELEAREKNSKFQKTFLELTSTV